MSHHVYTTEGIVIGSSFYGETHKLINLYTKELGLVNVIAQGVRKNESKLRFHIQDKNIAIFSLVKGKEIWRLTGAESLFFEKIKGAKRAPLERLVSLIKKMVHGEEKHDDIFELIIATYKVCLDKEKFANIKNINDLIEKISVLRLCYLLGYVKNDNNISVLLKDVSNFDEEMINISKIYEKVIISKINEAIKASHL